MPRIVLWSTFVLVNLYFIYIFLLQFKQITRLFIHLHSTCKNSDLYLFMRNSIKAFQECMPETETKYEVYIPIWVTDPKKNPDPTVKRKIRSGSDPWPTTRSRILKHYPRSFDQFYHLLLYVQEVVNHFI